MKLKSMMLAFAGGLILSASSVAGAQAVVRVGPPPPRTVVVTRAPHRGWVWQPGYYRYGHGNYIWVSGRWVNPPYGGAIWVPGQWRRGPNGYVWVAGRWSR